MIKIDINSHSLRWGICTAKAIRSTGERCMAIIRPGAFPYRRIRLRENGIGLRKVH
jgi:hypothetical protein